ncbi:hypothetical protein ACHAWF_014707 [Thalassiosira exigua]
MSSPYAASAAAAPLAKKAPLPSVRKPKSTKAPSLPSSTVEHLKAWMMSPEHVAHPYPTEQEKAQIMHETGIELKQLTNWFVNNRKRFWKPRVEAKLQKHRGPGAASAVRVAVPGSAGTMALSPDHGGLGAALHRALMAREGPSTTSASSTLPSRGVAPGQRSSDAVVAPPGGVDRSAAAVSDACSASLSLSPCGSDDDSCAWSSTGAAAVVDRALGHAAVAASTGCRRREEVEVRVLRPERATTLDRRLGRVARGEDGRQEEEEPLPALRDVTVDRPAVPGERVLASFQCAISYDLPRDDDPDGGDPRTIRARRDGEISRAKEHYLRLYLATRGVYGAAMSPVESPPPPSPVAAAAEAPSTSPSASVVVASEVPEGGRDVPAVSPLAAAPWDLVRRGDSVAASARKRAVTDLDRGDCEAGREDDAPSTPKRPRTYSTSSRLEGEDEWRTRCQNAAHASCRSLPGLDEAARMFGYVSQ